MPMYYLNELYKWFVANKQRISLYMQFIASYCFVTTLFVPISNVLQNYNYWLTTPVIVCFYMFVCYQPIYKDLQEKLDKLIYPINDFHVLYRNLNSRTRGRYFDFGVLTIDDLNNLHILILESEYPSLRDAFTALAQEGFPIYWYEEDNTGDIDIRIHENFYHDLILLIEYLKEQDDGTNYHKQLIDDLCELEKLLLIFPTTSSILYKSN